MAKYCKAYALHVTYLDCMECEDKECMYPHKRKENEWYSDLIDLLYFQLCVIAVKGIFGLYRIDELAYIIIYRGNI